MKKYFTPLADVDNVDVHEDVLDDDGGDVASLNYYFQVDLGVEVIALNHEDSFGLDYYPDYEEPLQQILLMKVVSCIDWDCMDCRQHHVSSVRKKKCINFNDSHLHF